MTEPTGTGQPSGTAAADADADRHRLSMTILMTPDMSNFAGNVHGGILLKYLDQVAYTCATRWARSYAVTLSVDQVVFREPIHVGELDRKSTRLNSSHANISYAVFCLKKKHD